MRKSPKVGRKNDLGCRKWRYHNYRTYLPWTL